MSPQCAPKTDAVPSASEIMGALLLDHLYERIDQLCTRLDALERRIDSQQARTDARMVIIEAELTELPGMIERGLRAALSDEYECGGGRLPHRSGNA